jgi:hypothetical protein
MRIISAKALPGYRLELQFDNGEGGVIDLVSLVGRGVFAAWTNPEVFKEVRVTAEGSVEWPGEIDLCPDSLYLQMTGKRVEELFPVVQQRTLNA